MLSRLKQNASPAALVLALVALFVAIGGVAGALPGKNTVNSGDIKKNTIKSVDIKDDGVTGNDVKESTLDIPAAAVPKTTFGAETTDSGALTSATLPGTTSSKSGNAFVIHFPRSVVNCVVVGSGLFDGGTSAVRSGTGNPNDVILANPSGTSVSAIVACP